MFISSLFFYAPNQFDTHQRSFPTYAVRELVKLTHRNPVEVCNNCKSNQLFAHFFVVLYSAFHENVDLHLSCWWPNMCRWYNSKIVHPSLSVTKILIILHEVLGSVCFSYGFWKPHYRRVNFLTLKSFEDGEIL